MLISAFLIVFLYLYFLNLYIEFYICAKFYDNNSYGFQSVCVCVVEILFHPPLPTYIKNPNWNRIKSEFSILAKYRTKSKLGLERNGNNLSDTSQFSNAAFSFCKTNFFFIFLNQPRPHVFIYNYILDQYFVSFSIFAEISEMLKKNRLEKLDSPVK